MEGEKELFSSLLYPDMDQLSELDLHRPILWHRQIRFAIERLEFYAANVDQEMTRFPWYPNASAAEILHHKTDVGKHLSLVRRTSEHIQKSLQLLSRSVPSSDPYFVDALYTFLAMASMWMINQIRDGTATHDSFAIADFFPDVPRSSGLFNLAPHASAFGNVAFDERSFFSCRISTPQSYEKIYLPERLAKWHHDHDEALERRDCCRWVAPQLAILHDQILDPNNAYKVLVLRDADGQEKYLSSDPLPTKSKTERIEEDYVKERSRCLEITISPFDRILAVPIGEKLTQYLAISFDCQLSPETAGTPRAEPIRIGVVIGEFIGDSSKAQELESLILSQNALQTSLQFELLPNTQSVVDEVPPGQTLNMSETQANLPVALEIYRKREGYAETYPISVLASSSFDTKYYVDGSGTWSVIALQKWIEEHGYPTANLLFASRLVASSVTFAGVLGIERHSSTLACLFDFTENLDHAMHSLEMGHLCPACYDAIARCKGERFANDIQTLILRLADCYIELSSQDQDQDQDQDQGQDLPASPQGQARLIEDTPLFAGANVKAILDYFMATSFKRLLNWLMIAGVGLFSSYGLYDFLADLVPHLFPQREEPSASGLTIVQVGGVVLFLIGFIGRLWMHLLPSEKVVQRRNELKRDYSILYGELKVLVQGYESGKTHTGTYMNSKRENCRTLADAIAEDGARQIIKDPTFRKLLEPQIDPAGVDPYADTTVEELNEFISKLNKLL
ncbi:MAG: hypothetical protein AAF529_16215 [Pseudomonadota bacterium]